jgi:predicted methyltransferase
MKTNKHQTLLLAKKLPAISSKDLLIHFRYSLGTGRSYLSHLGRQGLLERSGAGHSLTQKGLDRLQYFEVFGCADPRCPGCDGKSGSITCPSCSYQMPKRDARILKKRDLFLAVRHAGVYCPRCGEPIFGEAQARLLGIAEEK